MNKRAKTFTGLFAECCADEDAAVSLVDNGHGRWTVAIHFRDPPDERAVRALAAAAAGDAAAKALTFGHVAAKDWVRESLAGLQPVRAGRFVVHGAHDRARVPPSRIGIEIEAALAFGTGHHGTTRGCLLALDAMCKRLRKKRADEILDLGTGSGVLAIAAARALRQRVLATDIDPEAVRVARANARLNRAGDLVRDRARRRRRPSRHQGPRAVRSGLRQHSARTAATLRRAADQAHGARRAYRLSGLLAAQANAAIAAYRRAGAGAAHHAEGWTTLVFARRGS